MDCEANGKVPWAKERICVLLQEVRFEGGVLGHIPVELVTKGLSMREPY